MEKMEKFKGLVKKVYSDYDDFRQDFFKAMEEYSEKDKKLPLNISKEYNKDTFKRYKTNYHVFTFNDKFENKFEKKYKSRDRVVISKAYAEYKAIHKIELENETILNSYKKMPAKLELWSKRMLHANILFNYCLKVIAIIIKGLFTMGKKGTEFNKKLLKKEYTENELIKNYNLIFEDKIKSLKDLKSNEDLKENIINSIDNQKQYESPWAEKQQEEQ